MKSENGEGQYEYTLTRFDHGLAVDCAKCIRSCFGFPHICLQKICSISRHCSEVVVPRSIQTPFDSILLFHYSVEGVEREGDMALAKAESETDS